MTHTPAYKTILALVSGDRGDAPTLKAAASLATQFNGHVDIVFAHPRAIDLVPTTGEGVSAAVIEQLVSAARSEIENRKATAEQTVKAQVEKAGLIHHDAAPGPGRPSYHFRVMEGREDDVAVTAGLAADIIVLDRAGENDSPQPMLTIEEALIGSGRPLLVVPATVPDRLNGSVAIAWSPTPQAAHALIGSMPLLSSADAIHILTAGTGKTAADAGDRVVDLLARHGIEATAQTVDSGGRGVGAALLARTGDLGASVLIMGGYGHSRWRQMILGGVTHHILGNAGIPVLMAH